MARNRRGKPPAGRAAGPAGVPPAVSRKPGPWADPSNPVNLRHAQLVAAAMQALERGDLENARRGFRTVLDENIRHPDALHGMGLFARRVELFDTAASLIRQAIEVEPNNGSYWSNLGNVLQKMDRWDEAIEAHRNAVRFNPNHFAIRQNLGSALNLVDRPFEALPHFREALRLNPDSPDTAASYATTLYRVGEYGAALRFFRQALAGNPRHPVAHFNNAVTLNWMGRWSEGWPGYEWRYATQGFHRPPARFKAPDPLPDDLHGCNVLVFGEQGIGDEIRFATMVPDLIDRGAVVTLECTAKLQPLFERSFPTATVRPFPVPGEATEAGLDGFDIVLPTGSLGRLLRMGADRFPERARVLQPDPTRIADLKHRVAAFGTGPKIGLCWRSRARGRTRAEYYPEVSELGPVLAMPDATFVNLQYDECAAELAQIRNRFDVPVHVVEGLDLFDDLDGSAALTAGLDLVVSANTSVATIAGGVGVPTIEFHGRPVPTGYPISGHDPWFASVTPIGKRMADPWGRTVREIAKLMTDRISAAG